MISENSVASEDFTSAKELLQNLIARRKLLKDSIKDQTVRSAFDRISRAMIEGATLERLDAASLLGKSAEISKPLAAFISPILERGLERPLPHISTWGTADDRYYLAKALSTSHQPWIASYAAIELARADAAERASRRIWAELAIQQSADLAAAIRQMAKALGEDQTSSAYSTDTALRKLNRVATAIIDFLPAADLPLGDGFGRAFADLVMEAGGTNDSQSRELRRDAAVNFLNLMMTVLRLRFTATLDPDIYRAVRRIFNWWNPATPPHEVKSRSDRIAQIAVESLHTLSRQGVIQRPLRNALVAIFGAELINQLGSSAAASDPSLEPTIASWLSGRELREARSNPAVRELNEREADELIGRLLITMSTVAADAQSLSIIADDLELLEPRHSATLRDAATRMRLADQWAQAIGGKRRLALSGEQGQVVDYNPSLHQSNEDLALSRKVRIRTPSVVKQREGRPAELLIKNEVDEV